MADILFLEPFYTGSHKYFADGLIEHSTHHFNLITLPGRHWKWRMESSALELAEKYYGTKEPDIVMATNMLDLVQWKEFSGLRGIPHLLYVHENQLDYPLKKGEKRDYHFGWKDYVNYLAADRIIFNSRYNMDSFCQHLMDLSPALPGFKPARSLDSIRAKSQIIPPGCALISPDPPQEKELERVTAPVFLWNHRWEHDKNPDSFFRLLRKTKADGRDFKLILLGESYCDSPSCFKEAESEFREHIIHWGYAETREDYQSWLKKADYVFSTALQENFGISMVEAMSAGALPLLPERLAYPEVILEEFHSLFLYRKEEDLYRKLIKLMDMHVNQREEIRKRLRMSIQKYGWSVQAGRFDFVFESMVQ